MAKRTEVNAGESFGAGSARRYGLALAGALTFLAACRGQTTEDPPIHPNLNMDFQTKMDPQEENEFFEDRRAMRPLVPGTVARGQLKDNEALHVGKTGGNFITSLPVPLTQEFVKRGQERYGIYCTPCHGGTGIGDGIVVKHGMLPPPNFHEDRLVQMPVGQIYDAILNGVRGNMPAYAYAIPVEDRWAIVAYVRALQLARKAPLDQVPADIAAQKGWRAR